MGIAEHDLKKGLFTLLTPDEEGYVIARDRTGVPVALYFSSEDRAIAYKQAIDQPQAHVLFLRDIKEVEGLTRELVESGVKEAFFDHDRMLAEPEILDLEAWAEKIKPRARSNRTAKK